jgi:glycosyltransferase involved in cell wall biosynthesis
MSTITFPDITRQLPITNGHKPLVSIMMPAYNAEKYIGQAIESVLDQTYQNWELIIVNDGSKDGTANIIARFRDKRIKAISQLNGGEATARNTALKAVQGQYMAFLDADDVYMPHHLELTVAYLLDHPQVDAVYTDGHYCDQDGNLLQPLSSMRRGPFEGRLFDELVRASDVFGPPTCVVLGYQVIKEYNLTFDPAIVIGPDWDFMTRYSEHAKFGYLNQQTCLYRVHQTNITKTTKTEERALSLVRCREKAIQLTSYKTCPVDVRVYVFYDLLINLLAEHPDRQIDIIQLPEFSDLPSKEQSRLLRLMASKAIVNGIDPKYIDRWLERSLTLNPKDQRGALINACYEISPSLCTSLLRLRVLPKKKNLKTSLFGDLKY